MKNLLLLTLFSLFTNILYSQNNSISFNPNNGYIDCGNSLDFNPGEDSFTVEAWIRFEGGADSMRIVFKRNYAAVYSGFHLLISNAYVQAAFGDGTNISDIGGGNLHDGLWHHIAVVRDKAIGKILLYIDGVKVNEVTDITTNVSCNNSLTIGGGGAGNPVLLNAFLDEVRIWNVARSQGEIRANMYRELPNPTGETNLIAYYKFNESSGTTIINAEGNDTRDGTLIDLADTDRKPSSAFEGPGNALNFDGIDDFVDCGNDASLQITGALTIEAWVWLFTTATWDGIVSKAIWNQNEGGYTNSSYELKFHDDTNKLEFWLTSDGAETGKFVVESDKVLDIHRWYHVVAVYNPSTYARIYIDGKLDAEITENIPSGIFNSSEPLRIGVGMHSDNNNSEFLNGQIDELRIWNVVLPLQQIQDNFCNSLTGNETNLVAYYCFDNAAGTVLPDFTQNFNDGTLEASMEYVDCWVYSAAFVTWLNVTDSEWDNLFHWSTYSLPAGFSNISIPKYPGGADPVLGGDHLINDLVLKPGATLTINPSCDLQASGNLILEDDLDLNGQIITIGPEGSLIETTGKLTGGANGIIRTTRELNNIDENVAGLGVKITTAADLGTTTVIRGHEAKDPLSIKRYYQILPTNNSGLNATLVFNYEDSELNGQTESNLKLYKSPDASPNSWEEQVASVVNTTDNTLTLTGIDDFSWWTAGPSGGMPVELNVFRANVKGSTVELKWETATETNNSGFQIERKESKKISDWKELDFIEGCGNSVVPQKYSYLDKNLQSGKFQYRLKQIDMDGSFEYSNIVEVEVGLPTKFELFQNYPNPFSKSSDGNAVTTIEYSIPEFVAKNGELVILKVYDILGRNVADLVNEKQAPGNYSVKFNAANLPSGIYLYTLRTENYLKTKKMIIIK